MAEFAFEYWERVDALKGDESLKDIAKAIGLSYGTLRDMRFRNRYPKNEVSLKIAQYLNTTVEFLTYGTDKPPAPSIPPRLEAIYKACKTASDLELEMIERILHLK